MSGLTDKLARARETAAKATPGPLEVECPRCGAPVGEHCRIVPTHPGPFDCWPVFPERKPHSDRRVRLAQKEGER